MSLQLRQVAIVAGEMHKIAMDIGLILNLEACHIDPGVEYYGLKNTLWPIGRQFLEVVVPIREGTTGGRYLQRRGGDSGYLICTETDDLAAVRARVAEAGVRIITDMHHAASGHEFIQLHPADTGGCIWEIDYIHGKDHASDPWPPAGAQWQAFVNTSRVSQIFAAEFACEDPETMASLWSRISGRAVSKDPDGQASIELDGAVLRFAQDGRGSGFTAMSLKVSDPSAVLRSAESRGCRVGDRQICIGGVRIDLLFD